MPAQTVIVIGAGLAGLSCGCYAQMNGYSSRIFEHHEKPGGVAAAWRRGDYLIDGGIHFLMGHRPGQSAYELYRELGATGRAYPDLTTYGRFIHEPTGVTVDVTPDLDRLAADLKAIAPEDQVRIDGLVAGVRSMQGSDWFAAMVTPPELMGPMQTVRMFWGMRSALRYYRGPYSRPMSEFVREWRSPVARDLLLSLFMPEVPAWFVLGLLALVADRQMGLLDEGCPGFVLPIEERYRSLGGTVQYSSTVETILVEEGSAVGIRLRDGTEHRAGIVVSAADGRATIFGMLGGRYVDADTRRRYDTWQVIRPTVMVSLGVKRTFSDQPHLLQLHLVSPIEMGPERISAMSVRIFNYGAGFAPVGRTVVQAMMEVDWDYWESLRVAGGTVYAEAKKQVAGDVIDRLERQFPGIAGQVDMVDVATPCTTWRYTLNHRGAYMGWMPTPANLMTQIRRTLPGLKGFFMAGQWVAPGGSVPACLYSGRHVVQILCHQDHRPFTATVPVGRQDLSGR